MKNHSAKKSGEAGISMTELMVAATILVAVGSLIAGTMSGLSKMTAIGSTQNQLQERGERALEMIVQDLKRSGWVNDGVNDFPFFFEDGEVSDSDFVHHAHARPVRKSHPSEPDHGPTREIVMLLPKEVGAEKRPEVDTLTGKLSWEPVHVSYALLPGSKGYNLIERRVNGAPGEVVAQYVERMSFEDAAATGFEIPLNSIRIRIWLRKADGTGVLHRHYVEATVRLRNGGIQGAPIQ